MVVGRSILFSFSLASSACVAMPFLQPVVQSKLPTPSLFAKGGVLTPLSTKLADAHPYESWIEIVDPRDRATPADLAGTIPTQLGAGYFRIEIKSFCLHAGAPASSTGEGFALAPYKGMRADVLRHVVERSARHREIAQSDVQRLLWSIEYGEKVEQLPPEATGLLDASDIATLSINADGLKNFVRVSLGANTELFGKQLVDPNVPFADLERIAVPLVAPPKNLGPSHWTFVGHGLYVRATSQSYRETQLELYRPQPYTVERDASKRIVSITSGTTKATIRTDRRLGHGVAFKDLPSGEEIFIPDTVLTRTKLTQRATTATLFGFPDDDFLDKMHDARERANKLQELKHQWDEIKDAFDHATQPYDPASIKERSDRAMQEMETDNYMKDVLYAGIGQDLGAKAEMIKRHLYNLNDVWNYVICQMRGQCDGSSGNRDGADATQFVAVPHDTGRQRLGLSNASFSAQ